ncbi:MAG: hypothetical protein AAF517_14800 [Planctomycetota bacterium]
MIDPENLYGYYLPVLIGTTFAGLGAYFTLRRTPDESLRSRVVRVGFGLLVLTMGSTVVIITSQGEWPWEHLRRVQAFFNRPADRVSSIRISPHPNSAYASIVSESATITSRAEVTAIVSALNKATFVSLNHPRFFWSCVLEFEDVDGTLSRCVVDSTVTQGTVANITYSEGDSLHSQSYRSDELKTAIRAAVGLAP